MYLWLNKVTFATGFLLLASQFIPVNRNNPAVDSFKSIYATQPMPAEIRSVFERSCKDCHSNETAWPWYSYVAPVSWVIARDVHRARRKMNLSEWGGYPAQQKEDRLEEICEQVTNGEMPDRKYVIFHRTARITPLEREAICEWTEDSRQY